MDFIEDIRVSQEGAEAGFRAEIDRAAAIFDTREIGRVRVAEFSSTEGNEMQRFLSKGMRFHTKVGVSERTLHLFYYESLAKVRLVRPSL